MYKNPEDLFEYIGGTKYNVTVPAKTSFLIASESSYQKQSFHVQTIGLTLVMMIMLTSDPSILYNQIKNIPNKLNVKWFFSVLDGLKLNVTDMQSKLCMTTVHDAHSMYIDFLKEDGKLLLTSDGTRVKTFPELLDMKKQFTMPTDIYTLGAACIGIKVNDEYK